MCTVELHNFSCVCHQSPFCLCFMQFKLSIQKKYILILTMMSVKQQQHCKSDILASQEILAVLGVQWDLALQDLLGLLPRQVVQVALDPPFLLAPLVDPVHQLAPEDPSPLVDLRTVTILFSCYNTK